MPWVTPLRPSGVLRDPSVEVMGQAENHGDRLWSIMVSFLRAHNADDRLSCVALGIADEVLSSTDAMEISLGPMFLPWVSISLKVSLTAVYYHRTARLLHFCIHLLGSLAVPDGYTIRKPVAQEIDHVGAKSQAELIAQYLCRSPAYPLFHVSLLESS